PAGRALVLIGDPKQAIYSFRGADVWSYLDAARRADQVFTLDVNWRSDRGLVQALDALMGRSTLGHPEIACRPVQAAPGSGAGLKSAPCPIALRARVLHRGDGEVLCIRDGTVAKPSARDLIAADLASDLVGLLSSGALVRSIAPGWSSPEEDHAGGVRVICPADVAVLVPSNREGSLICDTLGRIGVPVVLHGGGSVFAAPAAQEWLQLLEALERPASAPRARAVALGSFVGWDPERLAAAGDDELGALQADLHHWAGVLGRDGVAALAELITVSGGLPGRLLRSEGGERRITDLAHVAELLHAEAVASQRGIAALATWLRQRVRESAGEESAQDRTRRLDSDADAVQVITVHRSKGLEFPVVYLPFMWSSPRSDKSIPVYHEPDRSNARTIDVGGKDAPGYALHKTRADAERQSEQLRMAYVALTRARHQVVLWWAGSQDSRWSALGRLIFRGDEADPKVLTKTPDDATVERRLQAIAEASGGNISVERLRVGVRTHWRPARDRAAALEASSFDRVLDTEWRRSSYTGITAAAHGVPSRSAAVGSEPEPSAAGGMDEPASAPVPLGSHAGGPEVELRALASPMAGLPSGAPFGTLVHSVLESIDFAAADLDSEMHARLVECSRRNTPVRGLDPVGLIAALGAAIDTPLGPDQRDLRLRALARGDRLDEVDFELPLAGGDRPSGAVTLEALADSTQRWVPPEDPLAGYPDRLRALGPEPLRGYLTGSIDLVFRTPIDRGRARYVVVDYKTNWLSAGEEPLSAWHYRHEAMATAMEAAHYPLQALLYSVALHRYLRWRLSGYDPTTDLGGVLYLFLRGMSGPATPVVDGRRCGVFAWAPPAGLILELSDLFDRGDPAGTGR
ncbi:MAG: 3'-5' exonuclease, partial [Acidimicrobiales bacterium]